MKTIPSALLLLLGIQASVQAQVTPADMPAILDLVSDDVAGVIHKQRPSTHGRPIFVDPASLPAIQKLVPGLSKLPAEGRHYRVLPERQPPRGIVLTVSNTYPGTLAGKIDNSGRVNFMIDPKILGHGDLGTQSIIVTLAKQQGKWKVVDGLILAEVH